MLVVIGGHARNTGKTSAICELIRSFPERQWTAIKISPHRHHDGAAFYEEQDAATETDTSRYLAAGAKRALMLSASEGQLLEAMPGLRAEVAASANCVLESNAVLQFLRPNLCLAVFSTETTEFKASAQHLLHHADAFLVTGAIEPPEKLTGGKPCFHYTPGESFSAELLVWLAARLV